MKYEYLKYLKENNQTIKILNSDNFAFTLSFFHLVFIKNRNLTLTHSAILQHLDDYLFDVNQSYKNSFVKSAKEYLDDFANDKNAYLRKYHSSEDEALYELTPHVQKALEFLESLEKKEFVGSRSKFNIVFELLEELEFETNFDDVQRVEKLEAQKREIDKQIEAIKSKQDLRFDDSRIKEHFMQIDEIVRKLKYDFSEIEYNFRDLNIKAMEQIITQDDAKGAVLGTIFEIEDSIRESDQGKSFFAFWQLLTDSKKSEKLSKLLENLYEIQTIKEFDKEKRLKEMKYGLLQSGAKISKVSSKLMEQLRRFLDDRSWIENRRVLELCKQIQKSAIDVKDNMPIKKDFALMDDNHVKVDTVFEKSLYSIKQASSFKQELNEQKIDMNIDSFYDIFFIDEQRLKRNVSEILLSKPQCSVKEIADKFAIKKGVAELIGYLSIAKNSENARVMENSFEEIQISDSEGDAKMVKLPKIIFFRG
jgi:hypothetical protein